ncbi:MAG: hypothetical protein N7Q72_06125, partial [Spiroplasma sp. Tabriz.8]|nr:hypothetical protein [Spiroplasma sp. Tabriz.8]
NYHNIFNIFCFLFWKSTRIKNRGNIYIYIYIYIYQNTSKISNLCDKVVQIFKNIGLNVLLLV